MGTLTSRTFALISGALLMAGTLLTASCTAAGHRDILWDIVTNCLDPSVAGYDKICSYPLETSAAACRKTTSVWDKNDEFVILRDRKMCDCRDDTTFVHGLAIPRSKVTGAEDPNRPDGIWRFAWDNAVRRIGDESQIALVANPPGLLKRSQDQLHVHLVRLNDAGRRLVADPKASRVQRLDDVWKKAGEIAREKGLDHYGVLVAKSPAGGVIVAVDNYNLEYAYTVARCP